MREFHLITFFGLKELMQDVLASDRCLHLQTHAYSGQVPYTQCASIMIDMLYCNRGSAGVRICLQQETDGTVYIKTIVSGGAAERDGTCQAGDMIVCILRLETQTLDQIPVHFVCVNSGQFHLIELRLLCWQLLTIARCSARHWVLNPHS